jgi:hypothetical protein
VGRVTEGVEVAYQGTQQAGGAGLLGPGGLMAQGIEHGADQPVHLISPLQVEHAADRPKRVVQPVPRQPVLLGLPRKGQVAGEDHQIRHQAGLHLAGDESGQGTQHGVLVPGPVGPQVQVREVQSGMGRSGCSLATGRLLGRGAKETRLNREAGAWQAIPGEPNA